MSVRRIMCTLNGSHNRGAVRIPLSPRITDRERVYVTRCETCGSWSVRRA